MDVWSLGIMLVTLLMGSPPFHTGNTRQTLSKATHHQSMSLPESLSLSVHTLIHKLLSKSSTQRINSFGICATAVDVFAPRQSTFTHQFHKSFAG